MACLFASISMCSISDDHYDYKMAELACGAE